MRMGRRIVAATPTRGLRPAPRDIPRSIPRSAGHRGVRQAATATNPPPPAGDATAARTSPSAHLIRGVAPTRVAARARVNTESSLPGPTGSDAADRVGARPATHRVAPTRRHLSRILLIEDDYGIIMRRAEIEWLDRALQAINDGELDWTRSNRSLGHTGTNSRSHPTGHEDTSQHPHAGRLDYLLGMARIDPMPAYTLRQLAAVVGGHGAESLLNIYSAERHAAWQQNVDNASKSTLVMSPGGHGFRATRDAVLALSTECSEFSHLVNPRQSSATHAHASPLTWPVDPDITGALPGDPLEDRKVSVRTAAGVEESSLNTVRGTGFAFLRFELEPSAADIVVASAEQLAEALPTEQVRAVVVASPGSTIRSGSDLTVVEDSDRTIAQVLGARTGEVFVVRPDGLILCRVTDLDPRRRPEPRDGGADSPVTSTCSGPAQRRSRGSATPAPPHRSLGSSNHNRDWPIVAAPEPRPARPAATPRSRPRPALEGNGCRTRLARCRARTPRCRDRQAPPFETGRPRCW